MVGEIEIRNATNDDVGKILSIDNIELEKLNNNQLSKLIIKIFLENDGKTLILSNTNRGKNINSQLAYEINADLITNAIATPKNYNPIQIKCKAFSSKAFVLYECESEKNRLRRGWSKT